MAHCEHDLSSYRSHGTPGNAGRGHRSINVIMRKLMVLTFAIAVAPFSSMHAQTTHTNCSINGDSANCTSTTDDSAQRRQKQAEELGKSLGDLAGAAIAQAMRPSPLTKQEKAYCKSFPNGQRDACAARVQGRDQLVASWNQGFTTRNIAGYVELSGDTFTVHSEQVSAMRFHMVYLGSTNYFRQIGIKTFIYTNDDDQRYVYDVTAGHQVTP